MSSQLCDYCNNKQTPFHLFCECLIVKRIWKQFKQYLIEEIGISKNELFFSNKNIMLNNVHPDTKHIVNLLVLVIKQYVFACKCLLDKPNFKVIKEKIEKLHQLELYNVKQTGSIQKHIKKWATLTGIKYVDTTNPGENNIDLEILRYVSALDVKDD